MTRVVVDTSSSPVTSMIATKKNIKQKSCTWFKFSRHPLSSSHLVQRYITPSTPVSSSSTICDTHWISSTESKQWPFSLNYVFGDKFMVHTRLNVEENDKDPLCELFFFFFYWKSCCSVSRLPPYRVLWVFLLVNLLSSPLPIFLHLLADCHRLDLNNTTYLKAISTIIMISNKRNQL